MVNHGVRDSSGRRHLAGKGGGASKGAAQALAMQLSIAPFAELIVEDTEISEAIPKV